MRTFLSMLFVIVCATASNGLCAEKTLILDTDSQMAQLNLVFNIGGATLKMVQSTDTSFIVKAVVTYSDDRLEPSLIQTDNAASFNSGVILGSYPPGTVHDWQITVGAYATPTNLDVNLGGVSGDMDFGGMPLKNIDAQLGGCSLTIDFSTPTQSAVDWIQINAGGVGMSLLNIGNTDFNNLVLDAGGGLARLDFSGTYSEGKHICKSVIAGSKLNISVPQSAGESLQATTVAAPLLVSGEGWIQEIKNPVLKKYVTDDYETQSILIDIYISAAGSAIDVNR
jgi:hypothetical protein